MIQLIRFHPSGFHAINLALPYSCIIRFAPQLEALKSYEAKSDIELVALVVLYDQLPRNVHRGTPQVRRSCRPRIGWVLGQYRGRGNTDRGPAAYMRQTSLMRWTSCPVAQKTDLPYLPPRK